MGAKSSVNKNTVYNTLKSVFSILFPLITFPYISRVLMAENVGKVNFGNSIISYFSLLASLGVTSYAVRECAKVRDDRGELGRVSSQVFSINMLSTLVAYIALAITLLVARPLGDYRLLIGIQSVSILFATLGADWLNTAMEDFRFIAVRTVSMQALSLILMFLLVRKPEDYMSYAVISVVASSGASVANILYRRKYCRTRFTFSMNIKKHLPPILLFFSMLLSQTIYCNSDVTMLGLLRGDFEVGLYSTSVKIYNLVNTTVASVAWVVMPQLSFYFTKKNYLEINRLLRYALNFILVLGLPCIVGIDAITPQIIEVIAGRECMGAVTSLRILTVSLAFSFIGGWVGNMILLPSGRERVCLYSGIVSAAVNIVLNFIFIPEYGLNAAAATTAVSELIALIIAVLQIEKEIKIQGFKEMLRAPIAGSAGIVLISLAVKAVVKNAWVITASTIVLSLVVYLIAMIVFRNEFFFGFVRPLMDKFLKRKGKQE